MKSLVDIAKEALLAHREGMAKQITEFAEFAEFTPEGATLQPSEVTIRAILQMRELPFPMGYRGLPLDTVVAAEAYSDWRGVTDPIARKKRVLSWVMDHLRNTTPIGGAMPPLYQQVKDEKHRLIHDECDLEGRPLECGFCNIPEFVDPLEDENA